MDLAKMSDAELEAIAAGKPAPKLSAMSDAELERIAGQAEKNVPIVQEMHPDISAVDRALAKNFAADDEQQLSFIQKKYPQLEVKRGQSGQIIVRRPGAKEYMTLDPNNSVLESINPFRKETWRDLADLGADAVTGTLSGLASGMVGVGAAAATGGAAAIPAAMVAGGVSSGALEGLRQLAGYSLGVNEKPIEDMGEVGAAGIAGGVSPLLFGTGATAKQIAKAGVSKAWQKGLVGHVVDNAVKPVATKVGGVLSGTGADALKTLAEKFPAFERVTKARTGVLDFLDKTGDMLDNRFKDAKDKAWNEFQSAVGDYGDEPVVDLAPVKQRFKEAIANAKMADIGTEASGDLAKRLQSAYDNLFTYETKQAVPQAVERGTGMIDVYGKEIKVPDHEMVERTVKAEHQALSPKHAVELEKKLSELAGFDRIDNRQLVSGRMTPSMTSDDKALEMIAGDLKRTLGQSVEEVLPENAIPAKRRYGKILDLKNDVDALTSNPRQSFTNLRNADVSSNITNIQQFRRIDDAIGTDLEKRAKFAEALDLFGPGRKSWFHGGWSRVPAAALGGATGAYLGRQSGSGAGYETGLAGAGLGYLLGSPAAMRSYIKYGLKAGKANKALAPLRVGLGKELLQKTSPWDGIGGQP